MRNADLALYAAKAQGGFRHVTYAPVMHDAAVHRIELDAERRTAVAALGRAPDAGPRSR